MNFYLMPLAISLMVFSSYASAKIIFRTHSALFFDSTVTFFKIIFLKNYFVHIVFALTASLYDS